MVTRLISLGKSLVVPTSVSLNGCANIFCIMTEFFRALIKINSNIMKRGTLNF